MILETWSPYFFSIIRFSSRSAVSVDELSSVLEVATSEYGGTLKFVRRFHVKIPSDKIMKRRHSRAKKPAKVLPKRKSKPMKRSNKVTELFGFLDGREGVRFKADAVAMGRDGGDSGSSMCATVKTAWQAWQVTSCSWSVI